MRFGKTFWADLAERALIAWAGGALAILTPALDDGLTGADLQTAALTGLGPALLMVLSGIVSAGVVKNGTASLVPSVQAVPPVDSVTVTPDAHGSGR